MFRRLAIIGGGAAAATLLGELLARRTAQPLHLDWYCAHATPGRGVAYGTPCERHLLNVRAASMSLSAGQPRGFLDFLQQTDPAIAGTDFVPRRRYGDYLEAEVARALQLGKRHGHDVRVVAREVDALVPEQGGLTVIHGEEHQRVDAAVLALGALPPEPLAGVDPSLLGSDRYVVDPWPLLTRLDALPVPRKMAVIGLGLTAVDVLLELAAHWPQTTFVALSRHGLLPEPHLHAASAPADDSAALIEALHEAPEIRRWLHLLREAMAQEEDWRTVLDSLRPHTPGLWRALPHEQRARFLRHARWAWERARHRMAPQVQAALAGLETSGRLQRWRGRVRSVQAQGDGLTLQVSQAGQVQRLQVDMAVQTTGLHTDVRRTGHRLVSQLMTNAHILADPLGLGMQADDHGRLRHADGCWPHLFALGNLLRGTRWESTAMPEIRQQARALADQLLAP